MSDLFEIALTRQSGEVVTLKDFKARAWLVVNTASRCGFTGQYAGFEELWQCYQSQGLMVLGFPCNQFGRQEPGTDEQIADFCSLNYGVSFPLFCKVKVNGVNTHPLFAELKRLAPGIWGSQAIKWNFTKFLISESGAVERFAPQTEPQKLINAIEKLLQS